MSLCVFKGSSLLLLLANTALKNAKLMPASTLQTFVLSGVLCIVITVYAKHIYATYACLVRQIFRQVAMTIAHDKMCRVMRWSTTLRLQPWEVLPEQARAQQELLRAQQV